MVLPLHCKGRLPSPLQRRARGQVPNQCFKPSVRSSPSPSHFVAAAVLPVLVGDDGRGGCQNRCPTTVESTGFREQAVHPVVDVPSRLEPACEPESTTATTIIGPALQVEAMAGALTADEERQHEHRSSQPQGLVSLQQGCTLEDVQAGIAHLVAGCQSADAASSWSFNGQRADAVREYITSVLSSPEFPGAPS